MAAGPLFPWLGQTPPGLRALSQGVREALARTAPRRFAGSMICSRRAPSRTLSSAGSPSRSPNRRATMQLELAFLERPVTPAAGPQSPWDQIDPRAQIAALEILARLIAQTLAANSVRGKSDE